MLYIKNINIITCTDKGLLENAYLCIEDDKITNIGRMSELSNIDITINSNIIDGQGKYLMPGLINCHEHIMCDHERLSSDVMGYEETIMKGTQVANDLLNAGFTTVRSMVDFHNLEMKLRDAINEGIIPGPDLFVTGLGMTATGGHFGNIIHCCDTVELARKYCLEQIELGADFIKVYLTGGVTTVGTASDVNIPLDAFYEIIRVAREHQKPVAVHCIGEKGVEIAAKAGVDSIEHGSGITEDIAKMIIDKNITLVPTILPGYMNYISPNRDKLPAFFIEKSDQYMKDCQDAAKLAKKMGIKIAMGTDGGAVNTPHDKGSIELQLLNEVGFTPEECLQIATINGANLLGLDDRGTVEIGKRADLILVEENPILNLKTLENVLHVLKAGKIVK